MKKFTALAGVAVTAAALAFPATAAQAVCANQAVWTWDGDAGVVKKWSTDGTLLDTVTTDLNSPDMAISSDLQHFLAFDNTDGELHSYNSSTGAAESSNPILGSSAYSGSGAGAGVIAGGKILVDSDNTIVSIDLSTFVGTNLADLVNADASVAVGLRGGSWSVAGDLLQLPDGDILVVASNTTIKADGVVLVRIDPANAATPTVVGTVTTAAEIWGAARGGDDIFLADENGSLLKVASIPTAASVDVVETTTVESGGGSFWGAAGSNDSTEGNATCELAETGVDAAPIGIGGAIALVAGAAGYLATRRRKA